jgi:TonB-linked SusC/RagA family outer membrane protein
VSSADAQQQQRIPISGKVVDANGAPLPGVVVSAQGTNIATVSNAAGEYSLSVPQGSVLVYSTLGYVETTQIVGSQSVINVTMNENINPIEKVVVVGYGSQKLTDVTGAVSSVNVERTLGSRPVSDVARGLQGSVPGLSVRVGSAEVGSDASINIRGFVGSYTGSNNPLILLDNVEIPSMQVVNPNDVEDITVMKDAASTSIYGSKAAFGVILITTKKGSSQDGVSVTYTGNFSWQNRFKPLEMGGIEGLEYAWDAAQSRNPNSAPGTPVGNLGPRFNAESIAKSKEWVEKYGKTGLVKPGDPYVYGRDWYYDPVAGASLGIRVFEPADALVAEWAPTMKHDLSLNGRSGKTTYNIGLGMLDQSGMTKNAKADDFKRYNGSLKLSTEVNKFITLRAGAMYSDRIKRAPSSFWGSYDPWLYANRWSSLMPIGVSLPNGDPIREPAYEFANTTTDKRRTIYSNFNLGTTITFTKDWNLEFDYSFVTQEEIEELARPSLTYYSPWYITSPNPLLDENGDNVYVDEEGNVVTDGGMMAYTFPKETFVAPADTFVSRSSKRNDTHTINAYTTYNLNLGESHKLKFMAGMNSMANRWKSHAARVTALYNFDNPQFQYNNNGVQTATGDENWSSLLGFFGRVNYSFADKYLLEANVRIDGTSKFPSDMWWATFPSFSAGWIASNEKFFEPIKRAVSFAKLRASWGSVGDQNVSNDLYMRTMGRTNTGSWADGSGMLIYTYGTPKSAQDEVMWQRIENLDFGADFQFLKGKLGLTFDWYQRDTKDMIMPGDALPATYGATAPYGNYGNLRTKGWELTLTYNHVFENGLGISALATMWDSKTVVTKGPDYKTEWKNRSIGSNWSTGATYGDIWGYVTDRLYQAEDFVYDADGNMQKTAIIINGTSKNSYMLVGDNPVYQTYLEDGGGVVIFRPGDVKYVDLNGDGYITPGEGTFGDPGDRKVIGNTLPRYEYGFRVGLDYKGFDFSVFIQGVGKREMWGDGQLGVPGYNVGDGAIAKAFATDYWRPDRTDAFYPRAWNLGGSNTGYSMQVQTKYLLNMAYTRIKNITLGYSVPAQLLKKAYISKARVYVSLENFFTFDNLRGLPIDPEVIPGTSMFASGANMSRVGVGTPMFKSASFGIELGF